jgi:uncharacterized tellurite resistance protein B-like protein
MKNLSDALARLFGGGNEPKPNTAEDMRIAAAALLVHASAIDGAVNEAESEELAQLLRARFDLTSEDANELIIAAERREREAIDIYTFTSKLKQTMTEAERQGLIFMMWEIAYADGKLDPLEDNLIWRAAELLGVSTRDRMIMKQRALAVR